MVHGFAGVGEQAGFFDLGKKGAAGVIEGQNPGVGGRGFQNFLGNTQEGAHDHPIQTGTGVALGFDGFQNGFQGGFPAAGVHETAPEAFGTGGKGFEFAVGHGTQLCQNGSFTGG